MPQIDNNRETTEELYADAQAEHIRKQKVPMDIKGKARMTTTMTHEEIIEQAHLTRPDHQIAMRMRASLNRALGWGGLV